MTQPPIAVVGAGIGGLTAALALNKRGFAVTVYEQTATLGEIGAGLHLSPNGMKVMRALDLEGELEAVAARPQAISTRDYVTGIPNFEGPLDAAFVARFGAPFFSFHRADLHAVLTAAAIRAKDITIFLDHRLTSVESDTDGVRLCFTDEREIAVNCVIGADGVHSAVRESMHGALGTRFTGHVAYRGMVARNDLAPDMVEEKLNIWVGPGKHVVAYPVRRGELINYVALLEEDGWDDESWTTRADAGQLAATFEDWNETVRALVAHTLSGECYKWALLGRDPLSTWSGPRTTLLGDAAHPMVPYLAQGAVMAIEDAWALAACLATEADCPSALKRYESARIERTTAVQAAAWEQGQLNHAVGRDASGDNFRGGGFADPAWIYAYDVVEMFPL